MPNANSFSDCTKWGAGERGVGVREYSSVICITLIFVSFELADDKCNFYKKGSILMAFAKSYKDLEVYQKSYQSAMKIFTLSRMFPEDERYSLTSQITRSSRSVCANLAEAFRKKIYPKYFISKINECEAEATETQNWIDFAYDCGFISSEDRDALYKNYDEIIGMLVNMRNSAYKWKPSQP